MRLGNGTIVSKDELSLYLDNSQISLYLNGHLNSAGISFYLAIGNIHSDKWEMLTLNLYPLANTHECEIRTKLQWLIYNQNISPLWVDTLMNFKFGESFHGFIYSIQIYDDSLSETDLGNNNFFYEFSSGCYYPILAGACLSTENDQFQNKNGQVCNCGGYISCGDSVDECIVPTDCDDYAEAEYPHDCLDPSTLCGSFQYLPSVRKCNFDCILNCEDCSSTSICDQCAPGFTFDFVIGVCISCSSNCERCDASGYCLTCYSGYFLDGLVCELCVSPCQDCTSLLGCSSCEDGYYLNSSNCVACNSQCATCENNSSCSSCLSGYFFDGLTCLGCHSSCLTCASTSTCASCPDGYYMNGSTCSACESSCETCINGWSCSTCEDGFYMNGSTCSACNSLCLTCTDVSSCSSCHNGFYLSEYSCLSCISPCDDCTDANSCLSCDPGFFLSGTNCLVCVSPCLACTDSSTCLSCQDGFFFNAVSRVCQACSAPCSTCSSASSCLSCDSGYYPSGSYCAPCSSGCSACVNDENCSSCSDGFYLDNQVCKACPSSCETCDSSSNCLSCKQSFFLSANLCASCPDTCSACTNASTCTSCSDPNSSAASGSCTCNEGYYETSGSCQACEQGCKRCNSAECLECETDNQLTGGECIAIVENCEAYENTDCSVCKTGFYLDDMGRCTECEIGCEECMGIDSCTWCKDPNSKVIEGICVCDKPHSDMREGVCECKEGYSKTEGEELVCVEESAGDGDQQSAGTEEQPLEEVESVAYSTAAGLTVSFISMVTMDDPTSLWTLLNTYQFISYLPLLSINYSQEVSNYLASFQLVKFFPNYFIFLDAGEELPRRFKDYGKGKEEFQNNNCIRNTGRYILLLAILSMFNLLFIFLGPLLPVKKIKEKAETSRKSWMSSMLRIWDIVSYDLGLSSSFVLFSGSQSSFSSTLWAFCIVQLNLILMLVIYKYTKEKELIKKKDPAIYNKIGTFLDELSNNNLWSSRYYFLLNARKVLSGVLIILFHNTPALVLSIQMVLSILFCIYFIVGKVFERLLSTILYLMAEITIFITFLASLLLSEFEEYSSNFGYAILATNIGFLLSGTFLKIVLVVFSYIKNKIKKPSRNKTYVMNFDGNNINVPDPIIEDGQSMGDNNNWKDRYNIFLKRNDEFY